MSGITHRHPHEWSLREAMGLREIVRTLPTKWIIGSRLTVALALLFPTVGGIQSLLSFCQSGANQIATHLPQHFLCAALGIAEGLCVLSFVSGSLLRVFAVPTIAFLGLRALSNFDPKNLSWRRAIQLWFRQAAGFEMV